MVAFGLAHAACSICVRRKTLCRQPKSKNALNPMLCACLTGPLEIRGNITSYFPMRYDVNWEFFWQSSVLSSARVFGGAGGALVGVAAGLLLAGQLKASDRFAALERRLDALEDNSASKPIPAPGQRPPYEPAPAAEPEPPAVQSAAPPPASPVTPRPPPPQKKAPPPRLSVFKQMGQMFGFAKGVFCSSFSCYAACR